MGHLSWKVKKGGRVWSMRRRHFPNHKCQIMNKPCVLADEQLKGDQEEQ